MTEIRKLKARQQVKDALGTRNRPKILDTLQLPLTSDVLVWREGAGWTGLHKLLARNEDDTACTVEVNSRPMTFRITSVKPYYQDENTEIPAAETSIEESQALQHDDDNYKYNPDAQIPAALRRRGRPKDPRKSRFPPQIQHHSLLVTYL